MIGFKQWNITVVLGRFQVEILLNKQCGPSCLKILQKLHSSLYQLHCCEDSSLVLGIVFRLMKHLQLTDKTYSFVYFTQYCLQMFSKRQLSIKNYTKMFLGCSFYYIIIIIIKYQGMRYCFRFSTKNDFLCLFFFLSRLKLIFH